jgi:hypothetical protein
VWVTPIILAACAVPRRPPCEGCAVRLSLVRAAAKMALQRDDHPPRAA